MDCQLSQKYAIMYEREFIKPLLKYVLKYVCMKPPKSMLQFLSTLKPLHLYLYGDWQEMSPTDTRK